MSMNFISIKMFVLSIKMFCLVLILNSFVLIQNRGEYRSRTDDLLRARQAL